ncbi:MAG: hypothetical protein Q9162_001027 [Coniocarpon cinnabarinum]
MSSSVAKHLVDPMVWDGLQAKIQDDTATKDQLRDIVQELEKRVETSIAGIEENLLPPVVDQIGKLSEVASQHPYYKFNNLWLRSMQDAIYAIIFCAWNGGFNKAEGTLLQIEEVGQIMKIPVNVKDRDTFHLTIEEYLHALVSLIDELVSLK